MSVSAISAICSGKDHRKKKKKKNKRKQKIEKKGRNVIDNQFGSDLRLWRGSAVDQNRVFSVSVFVKTNHSFFKLYGLLRGENCYCD